MVSHPEGVRAKRTTTEGSLSCQGSSVVSSASPDTTSQTIPQPLFGRTTTPSRVPNTPRGRFAHPEQVSQQRERVTAPSDRDTRARRHDSGAPIEAFGFASTSLRSAPASRVSASRTPTPSTARQKISRTFDSQWPLVQVQGSMC